MQDFAPRFYVTPVKDEEAESQRKAKSRHARQTRRSTQGVTLTDLKEAQKTYSLSGQDRENEDGDTHKERSDLRGCFTEHKEDKTEVEMSAETPDNNLKWSKVDKEGNLEPQLETLAEASNLAYFPLSGTCGLAYSNSSCRVGERWWRDENQNLAEDAAQPIFSSKYQQRHACCDAEDSSFVPQWTFLALSFECVHSRAFGGLPRRAAKAAESREEQKGLSKGLDLDLAAGVEEKEREADQTVQH
ncbi:protein phosphatase 1 regulatory subunit 12A-like [Cololabis saira]|uniref:protein phosphatase 1 regulatory subunit 12A-like n=1 Tax=Cololabis saira TaxID=129043 RepID=UPI002AD46836|nr:protein phosphatase 1 regulatory subunit 12A-like [Cololabis saira]